jgi:hypothetical protein
MDLNAFDRAMRAIGIIPTYSVSVEIRKELPMPAKSKAQFKAMQAAAHGKSTLKIPVKVGKEYAGATKNPKSLPARKAKK